jgi:tRNA pseudouridine55 synthase
MIAVGGAARLNDYIHSELPKTYLAIGKLGVQTNTGDYTGEVVQTDISPYLTDVIKSFSKEFIQARLAEKFQGDYYQSPHHFSAAKFQGRPLHEWAREGVVIHKEKVKRRILHLEVVKYSCPYLSIRFTVSSGTYVRTLFEECARELGTIGTLIGLSRESVGNITAKVGLHKKNWPYADNVGWNPMSVGICPTQILSYPTLQLGLQHQKFVEHGNPVHFEYPDGIYWVKSQGCLCALGEIVANTLSIKINFPKIFT